VPVKTIAVIIFDAAEAEWLVEKSVELALSFDAHLIGLHFYAPPTVYVGMSAAPMAITSIQDWQREETEKIRSTFDELARKNDVRAEFRGQAVSYGSETFLLNGARGADLVVVGMNAESPRTPDDRAVVERLIRNLGRPVLVIPAQAQVEAPFDRIAIGWSETREATRAAHDAINVAKPGAHIDLIALVARASDETPGFDSRDDFAMALDRLGFRAKTMDRMSTADHRGEELLRAAAESKANLLVAGAFGHSHFYDFMIGAVTSFLLKNAQLPVLLSR
jgi:nucleotide-binding universal stress UspA family protein